MLSERSGQEREREILDLRESILSSFLFCVAGLFLPLTMNAPSFHFVVVNGNGKLVLKI